MVYFLEYSEDTFWFDSIRFEKVNINIEKEKIYTYIKINKYALLILILLFLWVVLKSNQNQVRERNSILKYLKWNLRYIFVVFRTLPRVLMTMTIIIIPLIIIRLFWINFKNEIFFIIFLLIFLKKICFLSGYSSRRYKDSSLKLSHNFILFYFLFYSANQMRFSYS